jgi:hypothetical protein
VAGDKLDIDGLPFPGGIFTYQVKQISILLFSNFSRTLITATTTSTSKNTRLESTILTLKMQLSSLCAFSRIDDLKKVVFSKLRFSLE